jgi:hypothetical protein
MVMAVGGMGPGDAGFPFWATAGAAIKAKVKKEMICRFIMLSSHDLLKVREISIEFFAIQGKKLAVWAKLVNY